MKKIGIIGTGKIGSHLAEYLLSSNNISEIHLANRSTNSLHGRKLSLELRGHIINSKIKIKEINWENINDLDLISICVKDKYDPRELIKLNFFPLWFPQNLRYIGLYKDLPILQSLANRIKNYQGKIAVITNPVEITSYFISKWIPQSQVFGLGASLDSERLSFAISRALGQKVNSNLCLIAGERGYDMFSVSNLWKTDKTLKRFSFEEKESYIKRASKIGFDIMNDLGFTLHDCVPVFAEDIEWLLSESKDQYKSFAVGDGNSFVSLPIIYKNHANYHPFDDFTLDEKVILGNIELRLKIFLDNLQKDALIENLISK